MNGFDIVVAIFIGWGFVQGFLKGFVIEASGLLALIFGVVGAMRFSDFASEILSTHLDLNSKYIQIISFISLFVIIVYLVSLLAKMLTKTLKIVALGFLNQLMGALFGGAKWIIVFSVLVLVYVKMEAFIAPLSFIENSRSYNVLFLIGEFIFDWVSQSDNIIKNRLVALIFLG